MPKGKGKKNPNSNAPNKAKGNPQAGTPQKKAPVPKNTKERNSKPTEPTQQANTNTPKPTEQQPDTRPVTTPVHTHTASLTLAQRPAAPSPIRPHQLRQCFVNHFPLEIRAGTVHQYSITFTPELDSSRFRSRMLAQHASILGAGWLFDGQSIGFSAQELPAEMEFTSAFQNQQYVIRLKRTLSLTRDNVPLQVYALLFREIMRNLGLQEMGGKHFEPHNAIRVTQHNLELWPGYYTSVFPTMKGSILCVDVAHKIIRTESLLDIIYNAKDQRAAERELIGQVAITRYDRRTYRIDGIDWKSTPTSTFERKGVQCSFVQYYMEHHRMKITDRKQPLLQHFDRRSGSAVLLIPELCNITGLTDRMRSDFKMMRDLATHTLVPPEGRSQVVKEFAKMVNQSEVVKNKLEEWDVTVQPQPLKVAGRLLTPVDVFTGKQKHVGTTRAEWRVQELDEPVSIPSWVFVYPNTVSSEAKTFLEVVHTAANALGICMSGLKREVIARDDAALYEAAIKKHYTDRQLRVVVCMLQSNNAFSYSRIKQLCCGPSDYALPTQCVRSRSMRNPKMVKSVASKIVQQLNCKLGGDLWHVTIPLKGAMIVGIDVCHDTQSNKGLGKRSVVGFCASTNDRYTKYFSTVKFQSVGQEIVSQLAECFDEALENYRTINNTYPTQVIVYRDGVGDGQFGLVLDLELPQIKRVLMEKNPGMRLTVIIVQKRIHLRVFDHTGKNGPTPTAKNVPAGTVLDRACVSNSHYDFYLVSQHVGEGRGTVTPTHYHILLDQSGLSPENLQELTYRLAHLYYNWSGTIRVPAPCQYAHKIAFLVGQSIHTTPDNKLNNLLYFL